MPARGLGSPHAQTVFASRVRSRRVPPLIRERLATPDGDELLVDRLEADPAAPHLLILHGLEGSSRSGYVAALLQGAATRGWGAAALNFRSCGGELNRQPRFYHSGETGDPRFVLERLRAATTGPWGGVGFSLGGNVLLRLLAEGETGLAAAAAVSVPFDLQRAARAIDTPGFWPSIYRRVFLRTLEAKALAKARLHPGHIDVARVRAARTLQAYDDAVTAPLHGWESAAAYYAACSSGPVLGRIEVPTLIVSAEDDPMAPASCLPDEARSNPKLELLLPARGGHVGFVAGSLLRPRFWAEEQVLAFFDRQLVPSAS